MIYEFYGHVAPGEKSSSSLSKIQAELKKRGWGAPPLIGLINLTVVSKPGENILNVNYGDILLSCQVPSARQQLHNTW